ncbi:Fumarylacetoacetase [Coniochaeta ligniaria NRRL 30616]|uniref:Fumarylacetoacetase n=1 Tax=Coniochaeta ligniaria NRRL 30616 TaxID=1408157 RepID=A0A1J7JAJ7_9PEZI|nr:Fumarylacetoacetase [Coniochaeta ligniaria NRRL 30616]
MAPPLSWVHGTNDPDTDFSLANIPFGIISTKAKPRPHAAVAIGSYACDLEVFSAHPDFYDYYFPALRDHHGVFSQPTLNAFAALGRQVHHEVRDTLKNMFTDGHPFSHFLQVVGKTLMILVPLDSVKMHLPMQIGDYTDFYAGVVHATHVGTMFRGPENALQPNYKHIPVCYHGRSSSIVVSGTPVRRPWGQFVADPTKVPKQPETRPSQKLDFEVELGCFISRPNDMGMPIHIEDAEDHIFGYVLLNDWSARDIQAWEYVPLGPFNGKNFATTISPWVVLHEALKPFMTAGEPSDTELQPYLQETSRNNVFDIKLSADLQITRDNEAFKLTRTNAKHLLWSFPQMIAHHTVGGCPLRTGDLLGSGTISSVSELGDGGGSLLELSENGKKELGWTTASGGVQNRTFLLDGDTVTIRGFAFDDQIGRVGFGECIGRVEGALGRG